MDNPCIVIVREGISGGTASLSFRIIMALRELGYECMYFCRQINDETNYNLFRNNGIVIECIDDSSYVNHILTRCKEGMRYKFLVYSLNEYLAVEKLRCKFSRYNIESCLYYVVHHYAFGKKGCTIFEKIISIMKYRTIVKLLFSTRSLLFMSDTCLENARSVLSLDMINAENYVFYLPMKVNSFTKDQILSKKRHSPFLISTITRLEFPFKGYVMGLLDWFCNFPNEDIKMIIVGDGQDKNRFLNKLSSIDVEKKQRIAYYPYVQYDKLSDIFKNTDLYIGMGTTLIDAANNLTLALPVDGYTEEIKVSAFFSENIKELFAYGDKKKLDYFIQKLLKMSDEEYSRQITLQYELFRKTYNIDYFIKYLLSSDYDKTPSCRIERFRRLVYFSFMNNLFIIMEKVRSTFN